jgi:alkylation response protein AidB-like acyl-CoA dehydrogenase
MAESESADLDRLLGAVRTLEPLIRTHADETEQKRRLALPVVTAIADAGIFRMYTPRALGGSEVDPPTFFRVVEALARIDGSTSWCVFIAGANPLMGAFIADHAAADVFGRDQHVVTAGVVSPFGKAEICDGGYQVSGRWSFASGCQHSAWIFCVCQVFDGDVMRVTASGAPEIRLLFAPTNQVAIVDTWDVSGLAGTGSNDVVFDHVFVPTDYTCPFGPGMTPQGKHYQSPLYRYVLYASIQGALGAVALGIAQGAVDVCLELAQVKQPVGTTALLRERPMFQARAAEAVALVRSARAWLYASVHESWESQRVRGQVSLAERADLLLAAANATRSAAAAVDIVFTAAGATANYRRSPLQRALRDIHAVTQHFGTAPLQYESAGRMLLGLSPLNPLILF